jgi:hypothetical protein
MTMPCNRFKCASREKCVIYRAIVLSLSTFLFIGCQKPRSGPGGAAPIVYPAIGVVTPDITIRPQEESQWCWAASAQMVIEWARKQASQCAQLTSYEAKHHINHFYGNCCPIGASGLVVHDPSCNVGAVPDDSFNDAKVNYVPTPEGVAVSPEMIEQEVGQHHRPVAFSWMWTSKCPAGVKCGHMMVIVGYQVEGDDLLLTVYNPDPVPDPVRGKRGGSIDHLFYRQFKESRETYTHWKDFYGFVDSKSRTP